jgi:hypothetical protein
LFSGDNPGSRRRPRYREPFTPRTSLIFHRTKTAKKMLSVTSMAMSKIHAEVVCVQCESRGPSCAGTRDVRSTVDADAANPHRAGVAHDIG